jgi:hypothetical protein
LLGFPSDIVLSCTNYAYPLTGIVEAWRKKTHYSCFQKCQTCFRGWFITPLYAFLLAVGCFFAMVFVVSSMSSSDFCYDSPDQYALLLLDRLKEKLGNVVYDLATFYVGGCPRPGIPQAFKLKIDDIYTYLSKVNALMNTLAQARSELNSNCGTNETALETAAYVSHAQVCVLASTLYDLQTLFTCANWNSIYAKVAYDSICYNGVSGFVWIASAQFVIVLFSMIMLTLRAAFNVTQEERRACTKCSSCSARRNSDDASDHGKMRAEASSSDHDTNLLHNALA